MTRIQGTDARSMGGGMDGGMDGERGHTHQLGRRLGFGGRAARLVAGLVVAVAALTGGPGNATVVEAAPAPAERRAAAPADGDAYMARLLDEINGHRGRIGAPPVAYASPDANAAVSQYLADLTPMMLAYNSCFHGMNNPVAPGWDYTRAAGVEAFPPGEVLACPGPEGQWTPEKIADRWLHSPSHAQILYADPAATHVACGTYGSNKGPAVTVACVTFGD